MPNKLDRPSRVRPDAPVDVSLGLVPTAVALVALGTPLAVVAVVIAAVVPAVPWWVGIPVGLCFAGFLLWRRVQAAHDVVIDCLTEQTSTVTSVRLANMVNGLALAAGVGEPEAFVLNDGAANAIIAARNGSASIAISGGLVEALEPVELEGVIAEMLVRLRNGDAEASTLAASVFRLPFLGPVSALLTGVAAPIGIRHLLSEGRDLEADLQAVALTRYPPGLRRALTKARGLDHQPHSYKSGLDELWLINPTERSGHTYDDEGSSPDRSSLDLRIDVLTEL